MERFEKTFSGKKVFVTGHTGFKGSWLCEWLLGLGAQVTGMALPPPTAPALFDQIDLRSRIDHIEGDIGDLEAVRNAVDASDPEFVFHLAAQPLVRRSYAQPVETYATNVMGTIHVMEALRLRAKPCVAVIVTTDKCYENKEWLHGYREEDPMGGYDPYSSSKGAAELAIAAYRRSFFSADGPVKLASARAGNVIGGGDWAEDRIVPDCIRALERNEPILVRNRMATRPWQHVLEPIGGYLTLAAALAGAHGFSFPAQTYATAFNFGPRLDSNRMVAELVTEVLEHWPGTWEDRTEASAVHEAKLLNLATDKAFHLLGWQPRWDFHRTVAETVRWYRDAEKVGIPAMTRDQIAAYSAALPQAL